MNLGEEKGKKSRRRRWEKTRGDLGEKNSDLGGKRDGNREKKEVGIWGKKLRFGGEKSWDFLGKKLGFGEKNPRIWGKKTLGFGEKRARIWGEKNEFGEREPLGLRGPGPLFLRESEKKKIIFKRKK